jgi:TonB family protein
MRVVVRADSNALRSSASFSTSGAVHAVLLALVVFGDAADVTSRRQSLYDTAIRPNEKRIVWYHAPDRLPEVSPDAPARPDARALRATRKAQQRIVAGDRDDSRPPQLVWAPLPEVAPPKLAPLPNVLAVEVKAPARTFTPPIPAPKTAQTPVLPDAAAVPALRDAAPAGPALAPLRKSFTPPPAKATATAAAVVLPDAEAHSPLREAAPAGPALAPLRKTFTPPPARNSNVAAAVLPDAEAVSAPLGAAPSGPVLAPLRRTFTPSSPAPVTRSTAAAPDLPAVAASTHEETTRLAIIGLDPAKTPDIPAPPAPRTAGFSAGPEPKPDGAASDGGATGIAVPGVTIRDGVSRQTLLAAIRPTNFSLPEAPATMPPPTRVSSAPDPTLEGRTVYTLAIQMPNVTSYSGSWIVWFAAREDAAQGLMRAPSPLRKVDPKYIASAMAEGIEGVVRLGAVIRKDGHIDTVKLLRHLDDRLDQSAMESLGKWIFEPAARGGSPVDVDAVFEIPFRLAPKARK